MIEVETNVNTNHGALALVEHVGIQVTFLANETQQCFLVKYQCTAKEKSSSITYVIHRPYHGLVKTK